jgi:hypothetical protein
MQQGGVVKVSQGSGLDTKHGMDVLWETGVEERLVCVFRFPCARSSTPGITALVASG